MQMPQIMSQLRLNANSITMFQSMADSDKEYMQSLLTEGNYEYAKIAQKHYKAAKKALTSLVSCQKALKQLKREVCEKARWEAEYEASGYLD